MQKLRALVRPAHALFTELEEGLHGLGLERGTDEEEGEAGEGAGAEVDDEEGEADGELDGGGPGLV